MFSGISWYSYLAFLLATLIGYYLVVVAVFYKREIVGLLTRLNGAGSGHDSLLLDSLQVTTVDTLTAKLHLEIIKTLQAGATGKLIEPEIIMTLENLLAMYRDDIAPQYRKQINQYIINNCKHICSIHLDEEKAVSLWLSKR